MVLKAGNCGVCQDPMITSKRRRRPVSPVPSQVNAELAQARPCCLHSRYLMDLREETSDAATVLRPSFACLAAESPVTGSDRVC